MKPGEASTTTLLSGRTLRGLRRLPLLASFVMWKVALLPAQDLIGSLAGTMTRPTGAGIPAVKVTAIPLLETSTAEPDQNVSTRFLDSLPLFSRGVGHPRGFVKYVPGLTNSGEQGVSGSGGCAREALIDRGSALNLESSAVFSFPTSGLFAQFECTLAEANTGREAEWGIQGAI